MILGNIVTEHWYNHITTNIGVILVTTIQKYVFCVIILGKIVMAQLWI